MKQLREIQIKDLGKSLVKFNDALNIQIQPLLTAPVVETKKWPKKGQKPFLGRLIC